MAVNERSPITLKVYHLVKIDSRRQKSVVVQGLPFLSSKQELFGLIAGCCANNFCALIFVVYIHVYIKSSMFDRAC